VSIGAGDAAPDDGGFGVVVEFIGVESASAVGTPQKGGEAAGLLSTIALPTAFHDRQYLLMRLIIP